MTTILTASMSWAAIEVAVAMVVYSVNNPGMVELKAFFSPAASNQLAVLFRGPCHILMEDFFQKKNGKTASQIIAEAKASIKSNEDSCIRPTSNGRTVLSTKRPFTPRTTERSRPLSTSLSFRNPLVILEESDDESAMKLTASNGSGSNSKRSLLQRSNSAHSKLPMLVPASERQQFRPALGLKKRPQTSVGFKVSGST